MYHYKDPFNKKERNKRGENLKCEVSEAAIVNIVQVFRVSKPAAKDETPQTASRVPRKCRTEMSNMKETTGSGMENLPTFRKFT